MVANLSVADREVVLFVVDSSDKEVVGRKVVAGTESTDSHNEHKAAVADYLQFRTWDIESNFPANLYLIGLFDMFIIALIKRY